MPYLTKVSKTFIFKVYSAGLMSVCVCVYNASENNHIVMLSFKGLNPTITVNGITLPSPVSIRRGSFHTPINILTFRQTLVKKY